MLSTAEVDGAELVLTYDEALDEDSVPSTSAYTVTVAGTTRGVSSVDVTGMNVTLTLASAVQPNETVTVSYAVPMNDPVQDSGGTAAAALTDQAVQNNTLPVLSASQASAIEGDPLEFTVMLSPASSQTVTVDYTTADWTAEEGTDYTESTGVLTFSSGDTEMTITVSTTDDALDEGGETVFVVLSAATNAVLWNGGPRGSVAGTILDNDDPVPLDVPTAWDLAPSGLTAGDSFRLLFVSSTTTNAGTGAIGSYDRHVRDAASGGHAGIQPYSTHFRALGSVATIDARDHTATTYTETDLGVPIYWLGGDKVADDYSDFYDGDWDSNAPKDESGAAAPAAARVFTGSGDDGTSAGTAYLGAADETEVRVGEPGTSGEELDSGEGVAWSDTLALYGLSGIFTLSGTATLPVLSIEDATASEGESVEFTVTLTPESTQTVTVAFATASGTAAQGTDFSQATGTLTFSAGETEQSVEVTTTEDTEAEEDETFSLELSSPTNASLQGGGSTLEATGTIEDDDAPTETEVSQSSDLVPSGLAVGDDFRLLFVSSTTRNARPADIATYNTFVQAAAASGHPDIRSLSTLFNALGSTATVDARDNTDTTFTGSFAGVPIYWLGGDKVADDYSDFYDGDWDSNAPKDEFGNAVATTTQVFTGTDEDGTGSGNRILGRQPGNNVRTGEPGRSGAELNNDDDENKTNPLAFYGLSGVFTVAAAAGARSVNTVTLAADLEDLAETSGTVAVTVTATLAQPESADTELELYVRDGSATAPEDFTATPNIVALTIPAGQQAGTASFELSPVYEQDGDPECDEDLIVGGRPAVQSGASVIVLPTRITLTDPDVDALRCMAPLGQRPIRLGPQTDPDPLEPREPEPETGPDPPQAEAEPPPTPAKVALWTDRTAYVEGQPVRLYRSLHPMGDGGRYTFFYYLRRRGAMRRFYFAPAIRSTELEDDVVDQYGFGEGSFQAGPIKAIDPELIWTGAPRTAGLWQFVAEIRTADARQVVKTAYAKFNVTAGKFTEIGSDGLPTYVSTDQTWTNDSVYLLRHAVRVRPGSTLTLERGTVILGRGPNAAIVVERGAQINAAGTRASPVLMTCDAPVGYREPGCWRGLALLGNAPASGSGSGADTTQSRGEEPFGGDDPDDSSGTLRFVRVEFAGASRDPDDRPAAISFSGVGAGTVLDRLQAHESLGDGMEFRGGTAHCEYCVSSGAGQDLLAWSQGWTGSAKHMFLLQGSEGARGIDVRGGGEHSSAPQRPALYNVTAVGGAADGRVGPTGSGIALGPDTGLTVSNLVLTGFAGLAVESARGAAATFLDGRSSIRNAILYRNGGQYGVAQIGRPVSPYVEFVDRDPRLINTRYEANPDPRPTEGSAALRADVPADGSPDGSLAPDERFLGAFGRTNWLVEWTFFGPESDYRTAGPTGNEP